MLCFQYLLLLGLLKGLHPFFFITNKYKLKYKTMKILKTVTHARHFGKKLTNKSFGLWYWTIFW